MELKKLCAVASPDAESGTITMGMRCSHCEYDLRGNTSSRCPECGCEYDATNASPRAWRARRRDRLFRRLSIVVMLWPLMYVVDGPVFNGWFFAWLDRKPTWLSDGWILWTPVNGMVYMGLMWVAFVGTRTNARVARFVGAIVTMVLLAVIAGQIVLAVGTLL